MKLNTTYVLLTCTWCGLVLGEVFAQTPELVVQTGHSAAIDGITLNSNASLLAATSRADQKIKLYEVATRRELRTFSGVSDDQPSSTTLAFSPDSKTLVTGELSKIRFWDVATGKLIRTVPTEDWITSLAASSKSNIFAALSTFGSHNTEAIRIWSFNGNLLYTLVERSLDSTRLSSGSLALSDDGNTLASIDAGDKITLWDLRSRKPIRVLKHENGNDTAIFFSSMYSGFVTSDLAVTSDGWAFAFSQLTTGKELHRIGHLENALSVSATALNLPGNIFITGDENGAVTFYNIADQSKVGLSGHAEVSSGALFSPDGRSLIAANVLGGTFLARTADVNLVKVWSLSGATVLHTLPGHLKQVNCIAVSADSKFLASGSEDGTVRLWDMGTSTEVHTYDMGLPITSVALSRHAELLAAGAEWPGSHDSDLVRVWETNTGAVLPGPQVLEYGVASMAFSPDDRKLAAGLAGLSQGGRAVKLWDTLSWKEIPTTTTQEFPVDFLTFSPDGSILASAGMTDGVELLDMIDGGSASRRIAHFSNGPFAFSPSGKELARSDAQGTIHTWDIATGMESQRYATSPYAHSLTAIAVSPDGGTLASGSDGPAIHLWNTATHREFLQLVSLGQDTWVIVSPDGRFDTNNLDEITGLSWVFPDEPLHALAPEIFMRDYYQPKLLPKLLAREKLPQVRALSDLNRAQPQLEVVKVEPEGENGLGSVTVEVDSTQSLAQKDSSGQLLQSGAEDLRLFRDGQLVAQWPEAVSSTESSPGPQGAELEVWRKLHRIELTKGRSTHTFSHIRLPQRAGVKKVAFTAYAFNADRVKSLTTPPFEYALPSVTVAVAPRRAYLIIMGVNANQSYNLNLELAVSSAQAATRLLHEKLAGEYKVTDISLFSTVAKDSPRVVLKDATKANLKAVLDLLAGRTVDPSLRAEVDPKQQLRVAGPDDAVVFYVASHGYADPQGTFYLMPYDTGSHWGIMEADLTRCRLHPDASSLCQQAEDLLAHSISSADLAGWWNGVDAGEMMMILDSCHSGAAAGKEFRPAPLGDPGLGQLSYDKGMQILSASQPAQTERGEWVTGGEGRTLLVDALESVAKANPAHTLEEWLHDAEQQLPVTAQQLYPALKEDEVQVPMLLDFVRKENIASAVAP